MEPAGPALVLTRDAVVAICTGMVFLVLGLVASVAAVVQRRSGVRAIAWLAAWSGLYGLQDLAGSASVVAALPGSVQGAAPYVKVAIAFLLIIAATLTWRELSLGGLRRLLGAQAAVGLGIAVAGFGTFLAGGDTRPFLLANAALAVFGLLVLITVVLLPARLAKRHLVLPHRGVLAAGSLFFATEALYTNAAPPLGLPTSHLLDSIGFGALLVSFGYVALRLVGDRERRLLAIENELAVARRLQLSILPRATPELSQARVAAAYEPMTEVAGDFYEFLPVDRDRCGFLIADVSGHGVPAALIASMLKVAVHSVAASAADPSELLAQLRSALHGHLQGQYVTVAYLWLDTGTRTVRYAAAGHPPLVLWRAAEDRATRIVSNGLLFGVEWDSDYPACEIAVGPGDRLLLHTDGLTEPENAVGQAFGDSRLEGALRQIRSRPVEEVPSSLLGAVRAWTPAPASQQDDITLVAIDLL